MDTQNVVYHAMQDSSAFPRKHILTHGTLWASPEDTLLSEIRQVPKTNTARLQDSTREVGRRVPFIEAWQFEAGEGK